MLQMKPALSWSLAGKCDWRWLRCGGWWWRDRTANVGGIVVSRWSLDELFNSSRTHKHRSHMYTHVCTARRYVVKRGILEKGTRQSTLSATRENNSQHSDPLGDSDQSVLGSPDCSKRLFTYSLFRNLSNINCWWCSSFSSSFYYYCDQCLLTKCIVCILSIT